MKKQILIGLAAALVVTGILSFSVSAQNASNAVPFQALWDAVNQVRLEIAAAVASLQNQINNIQLVPGPKGEKGDIGERGIPGKNLRVVDANNKEIGLITEGFSSSGFGMWFSDLSVFGKANVRSGNILGADGVQYPYWGYTGQDCTGEIFVNEGDPYFLYQINDSSLPTNTFLASDNRYVHGVTIGSMRAPVSGTSMCINGTTEFANAAPVRLINLAGSYVPPFRIEER